MPPRLLLLLKRAVQRHRDVGIGVRSISNTPAAASRVQDVQQNESKRRDSAGRSVYDVLLETIDPRKSLRFNPNSTATITEPTQQQSQQPQRPNKTPLRAAQRFQLQQRAAADNIAQAVRQRDMESQMMRVYRPGEVYGPHDLTPVEHRKWRRAQLPRLSQAVPNRSKGPRDVFDRLGVNPLLHYKNFRLLGEFMTDMGRIKHSRFTGLRPVNQRRVARAIRRAVGIGLMPSVHHHPELLPERVQQRATRLR